MIQKTIIVFQETTHRYITLTGEDLNPIFERLCSFSPTIKSPKLSSPIQPHSIAIKEEKFKSHRTCAITFFAPTHTYAWHFQESGSWSGSLGKQNSFDSRSDFETQTQF
jgi:hypothetical protein